MESWDLVSLMIVDRPQSEILTWKFTFVRSTFFKNCFFMIAVSYSS